MQKFITHNKKQTQALGKMLAEELRGGEVLCLSGDLGSGKTTFTQGLLSGLKIKGPYTSPTFAIMKQYSKKNNQLVKNIYHIDTYRVEFQDILNLNWREICASKENVIIVEWAERIKKIIPKKSLWIKFRWLDESKREIIFQ